MKAEATEPKMKYFMAASRFFLVLSKAARAYVDKLASSKPTNRVTMSMELDTTIMPTVASRTSA